MKTLPVHVKVEQFYNFITVAYYKQPKLFECSEQSKLDAVRLCARIGLSPGGAIPEVHLVPFKNKHTEKLEVVVIPDYRGLIKLLRSSGLVKIEARVARKREVFKVYYGTNPHIDHEPKFDGTAGDPIAYYATAWLANGTEQFAVVSKAEVDNIREHSQGKNSLMWTDYYDEGGKKTAVKQLCKMLDLTGGSAEALRMGDAAEFPDEMKTIEATVLDDGEVVGKQVNGIKERLAEQTGKKDVSTPAPEEAPGPVSTTGASSTPSKAMDNINTMMDVVDKPKDGEIDVAKRTAFLRDATGDTEAECTDSYFRTFGEKKLEEIEAQIREGLKQ